MPLTSSLADPPGPRGGGGFDRNAYGGGGAHGGGGRQPGGSGDGRWVDGKHVPGPSNPRVERELFGEPKEEGAVATTGINFANYDDIPVEASGEGVPEAVTTFTNPPP